MSYKVSLNFSSSSSHWKCPEQRGLGFQVRQLEEDLRSACAERDSLVSEKAPDSELESMQTNISSLTEERDQLQEILQGLREENSQLKSELEEKDELVRRDVWVKCAVCGFNGFFSRSVKRSG